MYKVAGSVLSEAIPYIFENEGTARLECRRTSREKQEATVDIDPNISHIRQQNAYISKQCKM